MNVLDRLDDRDFATAVDFQVEDAVKTALREIAPEIPFLGEESGGEAIDSHAVWVLDPIDGTVNFARDGPLCGISLALVEERRPRIAVVDFPFLGERYLAVEGAGAFLNGRPVRSAGREPPLRCAIGRLRVLGPCRRVRSRASVHLPVAGP